MFLHPGKVLADQRRKEEEALVGDNLEPTDGTEDYLFPT